MNEIAEVGSSPKLNKYQMKKCNQIADTEIIQDHVHPRTTIADQLLILKQQVKKIVKILRRDVRHCAAEIVRHLEEDKTLFLELLTLGAVNSQEESAIEVS